MDNNFDPMTGEPVNKTENVAKKKISPLVWAIGGSVVAVVLLVVALVAAGVFRSDLTTITLAIANTFKDQPKFIEDLKVDDITKWVQDQKYAVSVFAEDDDVTINASIGFTPSEINVAAEFEGDGVPETDIRLAYNKKTIKAQMPAVSDIVFVYDYTKMPTGYMADMMDEDELETLNESLAMYWTMDTSKIEKKVTNAVLDVLKDVEIEKIDSKQYKVDGKKRKCKGYSLVLTDDEMLDMLDAIDTVYEEELSEDMYDMYAEIIDSARDGLREFPETELEIYIYKNKLACINAVMDDEDIEIEWLFKGGDFRIQNMEITVDNGYSESSVELEGKSDGSKEKYELSVEGEEVLTFEYDSKDGDFVFEADDSEFEGNLASEKNAITITFEVEDVESSITISKSADFEKISGEEFNIGEASEDDYMDLYEDNEELFEIIGDFDYYY